MNMTSRPVVFPAETMTLPQATHCFLKTNLRGQSEMCPGLILD